MESRRKKAAQLHDSGHNCCQSVVMAMLGDGDTLTADDARRLGACYGGGLGRGEVCGAVAGALMVLGLRHGPAGHHVGDEAKEAKKRSRDGAAEFIARFDRRHGSHQCRELLKAHGGKVCDGLIDSAVAILEEFEKE